MHVAKSGHLERHTQSGASSNRGHWTVTCFLARQHAQGWESCCPLPGKDWMAQRNYNEKPASASAAARRLGSPASSTASQLHVAEYLDTLVARDEVVYAPDAHAVWSEVLERNREMTARHGERIHPAYIEGLRALELPTRVPGTDELNARLRGTGWKIVAVDGYLPATTYASLMA